MLSVLLYIFFLGKILHWMSAQTRYVHVFSHEAKEVSSKGSCALGFNLASLPCGECLNSSPTATKLFVHTSPSPLAPTFLAVLVALLNLMKRGLTSPQGWAAHLDE